MTVLAGVVLVETPLSAQTVTAHGLTPFVLSSTSPPQVPFEAATSGQPTRVTLDLAVGTPRTVDLRDDGANGDRVAGDRIYTVLISSADIVSAMQPDDVHRVFVGYLNLFNGATVAQRLNVFADVYADDVGRFPIARLSQFAQATSKLVNIQDATYFLSGDASHVTEAFYRLFGDDYDFLNLIYQPTRPLNPTHAIVRSEVDGIGVDRVNNSVRYGSAGRLQGISEFPIPTFFDGADTVHVHELGHQWINYLRFPPVDAGIPHWPVSSMAGGVMGFSIGGEGGNFACDPDVDPGGAVVLNPRPGGPVFNDLDLYLMGLLSPDQVHRQVVFADQEAARSLVCTGQTYAGAVTFVTAQDVIGRVGPRTPQVGAAPTRFRVATILVTRDAVASDEAMWLYSWLVDRADWRAPVAVHAGLLKEIDRPFFVATGERASLDLDVGAAVSDFSLVPTPGASSIAAGASASYTIRVTPTRPGFSGEVVLSCGTLPAHASCTFSPARVVPSTNFADVTMTIGTDDAQGAAERVEPGQYIVAVIATSGQVQHNTVVSLTVQPGEAPQIYTLTGIITDITTHTGIAGARVEAINGINTGKAATTDAAGNYLMKDLVRGTSRMRASAGGYNAGEQNVTVPDNPRADFELTRTCAFTLSSSSGSVAGGYHSGEFSVVGTRSSGCSWTAFTSDSSWLSVLEYPSDNPTSVVFSTGGNTSVKPRTGRITVSWPGGSATFTVTQLGAVCNPSFTIKGPAAGGGGTSNLGDGCYYATNIASDVSWLRITGTHGAGLYLNWVVGANTGPARTGHITLSSAEGLYMQITFMQEGGSTPSSASTR